MPEFIRNRRTDDGRGHDSIGRVARRPAERQTACQDICEATAIPGRRAPRPGERARSQLPGSAAGACPARRSTQRWTDLTLHWPVLPEAWRRQLPPDAFADGMTYVGLVPFRMTAQIGTTIICRHLPETMSVVLSDNAGRRGARSRKRSTDCRTHADRTRHPRTPGRGCGCCALVSALRITVSIAATARTAQLLTITIGDLVEPLEVWLTAE